MIEIKLLLNFFRVKGSWTELIFFIYFFSDDSQGSCVECGRTFLKKDDFTSDKCSDCRRSPSPQKSPSSKKQLSDFSISKLTNDENTVSTTTKSPPKVSDIYDPRVFSYYNPMMLTPPTATRYLGHEHIPVGYLPVFGGMSVPDVRYAHSLSGLVPRFNSSFPIPEAAYQSHALASMRHQDYSGLIAK